VPGGDLALDVGEPTGHDELFLIETNLPPAPALAALAERVATNSDGSPIDWAAIPAARLAGVALALRRAWVGDRLVSEGICGDPGCGARFDVSFHLGAYLAAHRSRRPRNVTAADGDWYELAGSAVQFRVPSVADLLGALAGPDTVAVLAARTIRPAPSGSAAPAGPRLMARLDRALAAMAPSLVDQVGGCCPECGAPIALTFDPLAYTLTELRDRFAGIYRDTHTLAWAYHWSEESIHAMPRARRRAYAEMVAERVPR
jgi:hypothetical protein